ncbi:MAG: hypothetical protein IT305_30710 [Chloroflexi bacterium]|nr:hypothetical protein [Chloroflexota bacterium]
MLHRRLTHDQWRALIEAPLLGQAHQHQFSREEWQVLVEAPLVVSAGVMAAGETGALRLYREWTSFVRALRATNPEFARNRLVRDVSAGLRSAFTGHQQRALAYHGVSLDMYLDGVRERALQACRNVSRVLASFPPEEAEPFKLWLMAIAREVAESSRVGGFLGFGSRAIRADELDMIGAIRRALDLPSEPLDEPQ